MGTATTPAEAFEPTTGLIYLDSASYGLPPRATIAAMRHALDAWQGGRADWIADWDRPADETRTPFAALCGVAAADVALLPAVSVGVGMVAAALTARDEVVVPADEFTSVLFPLLVAAERGTAVREVPFATLAEAVRPTTTLVAFSLVQMQTGKRADLASIVERAHAVGARVLVDITQALPFLRAGEDLAAADYLVCAAYKHLLSPRGVAFMSISADAADTVSPLAANWRAADQPYGRYFGGPLTLGSGAARFDVSLAWLPWVGARESLRLIAEWQATGELARVPELASRLTRALGQPEPASTLVCVPVRDPDAVRAALAAAGIRASVRGTAIRLAPHVYTTDAAIDAAVEVLRPFVAPG